MTRGPFGGPRPFAEANLQLTFISDYSPNIGGQVLTQDIDELLGVRTDVAISEGGRGGNVFEGMMQDTDDANVITVTIATNELSLEAINLAVNKLNKSVREKIPKERILIGTTGGEGPAGGPRPIAQTTVNFMLNSEDEHLAMSPVAVEGKLRPKYGQQLEAGVSEGMQFAGETLTLITRSAEVPLDEVEGMKHTVEQMYDASFPARNVDVTAR